VRVSSLAGETGPPRGRKPPATRTFPDCSRTAAWPWRANVIGATLDTPLVAGSYSSALSIGRHRRSEANCHEAAAFINVNPP
jgi:hypothetical protein